MTVGFVVIKLGCPEEEDAKVRRRKRKMKITTVTSSLMPYTLPANDSNNTKQQQSSAVPQDTGQQSSYITPANYAPNPGGDVKENVFKAFLKKHKKVFSSIGVAHFAKIWLSPENFGRFMSSGFSLIIVNV